MVSLERMGVFKFNGQEVTVVGADILVGDQAPEFTAQAVDWSIVDVNESKQGKVQIIGSLPSVSTSVCDRETRRFNEEAVALGEDVAIVMISMDLPWTLKNWCAAAGVERVVMLSDHRYGEFGEKYGVLLKEPRIFRRAVFVVGRNGKVVYAEYMPILGNEPDYPAVLAAVRRALA